MSGYPNDGGGYPPLHHHDPYGQYQHHPHQQLEGGGGYAFSTISGYDSVPHHHQQHVDTAVANRYSASAASPYPPGVSGGERIRQGDSAAPGEGGRRPITAVEASSSSVVTDDDNSRGSGGGGSGAVAGGGGIDGVDASSSRGINGMVDFDDPRVANLPRILLMGPRRGGKTSIQRVVFHKMSPHETLFRLEATQNVERAVVDHTPLCRFTIWDFPGDYYGGGGSSYGRGGYAGGVAGVHGGGGGAQDIPVGSAGADGLADVGANETDGSTAMPDPAGESGQAATTANPSPPDDTYIFQRATSLIFVLDAQDEPYDHVLQSFTETVTRAIRANPHIAIEVFINKVDGELFLSDEAKYDCRRDVMAQVSDEIADAGVNPELIPISYHLTSIYDHSVFEAFSRVVQKLIPQLPTLENLLNVLVSTCSMEKAYLFDVASKLYISTDSSPVDMQSVELCSDMIDVVLDVSGIYGLGGQEEEIQAGAGVGMDVSSNGGGGAGTEGDNDKDAGMADSEEGTGPNGGDEVSADLHDELVGTLVGREGGDRAAGTGNAEGQSDDADDVDEDGVEADGADVGGDDSAYDAESSSVIRLSNGMVLYLKEVDTMLALVCLTRSENFRKKSLIDYNIGCLKKALRSLVQNKPPSPAPMPQHLSVSSDGGL